MLNLRSQTSKRNGEVRISSQAQQEAFDSSQSPSFKVRILAEGLVRVRSAANA